MAKNTAADYEAEIKAVRSEIKKLEKKLHRLCDRRDALFEEENADNYSDIEWLVNHPTAPGAYEATRVWTVETFGGEYQGITYNGYYPSVGQKAFGFNNIGNPDCRANIHLFAEKVLPMLRAPDGEFISFIYTTGQYSGIFSIDYRPEDGTWWTSNMRYSRTYDRQQHVDLDSAIDHAIQIEGRVDD